MFPVAMMVIRWLALLVFALSCIPSNAASANISVVFNDTQSSGMVLQQSPAKSVVYGVAIATGETVAHPKIAVKVSGEGDSYSANAVVTAIVPGLWQWKAFLKPTAMGGSYTISATVQESISVNATAQLTDVTFGDVWYCAGQSNMWLPLLYSFSRNASIKGIQAGHYDNIRLMAGDSQKGVAFPWKTTKQAIADGNDSTPTYSLFKFSAACYYFAESLTDLFKAQGKTSPVIGLINTAIGGSMIEEWTLNSTTETCANASRGAHDQTLYDKNVKPYLAMTVKGWLWYQGENNCHGVMGNSAKHLGYGCQLPAMIALWRVKWSETPGTTDPQAPFGVVTLAAGGSEGGSDIGGMRWSQTGNYGVLPNALMPNTFLAQAYDLGDPWGDKTCYGWSCCWNNYNETACEKNTAPHGGPSACKDYCEQLAGTPVYMGGIHPRIKKPVGERLAVAAMGVVYGGSKAYTGPTIKGCAVQGDELVLHFDEGLLKHDTVIVQDYNQTQGFEMSALQVLVNTSYFCLQPMLRCKTLANGTRPSHCGSGAQEWYCLAEFGPTNLQSTRSDHEPRLQGVPPFNPYENPPNWITLNITRKNAAEISVDLGALNGTTPVAVRYAWGNTKDSCCGNAGDKELGISKPCKAAACPIMSSSNLPANPFFARIERGSCQCISPQKCDQSDGASLVV